MYLWEGEEGGEGGLEKGWGLERGDRIYMLIVLTGTEYGLQQYSTTPPNPSIHTERRLERQSTQSWVENTNID